MAYWSTALVNALVAGNGGHTFLLVDGGQTLLVDNKLVPITSITEYAPPTYAATIPITQLTPAVNPTVSPKEVEQYSMLEASRQTAVYNAINTLVGTAISSGVALTGLTAWNTSAVLGAFTIANVGENQTVVDDTPSPIYAENFVFSGTVVGNELRAVTGKPNPITTRP